MTTADIWQIVIGIVSSVASFALSLIIFIRQIIIDKKIKEQDINNKVTSFIIENKEEISLLPLCVLSNCLHKTDVHARKIYTNFNKCEKEVQEEILKHENVNIDLIYDSEWMTKVLDDFADFSQKYSLGKNMLYEDAKYLHMAYDKYKEQPIEDINPMEFEIPSIGFNDPKTNKSLHFYIDEYAGTITHTEGNFANQLLSQKFIPPMDLIFTQYDLDTCPESKVSFWIMRFIISSSLMVSNRRLNTVSSLNKKLPEIEEYHLKTFEDMYYYTIYCLLKTFVWYDKLIEKQKTNKKIKF